MPKTNRFRAVRRPLTGGELRTIGGSAAGLDGNDRPCAARWYQAAIPRKGIVQPFANPPGRATSPIELIRPFATTGEMWLNDGYLPEHRRRGTEMPRLQAASDVACGEVQLGLLEATPLRPLWRACSSFMHQHAGAPVSGGDLGDWPCSDRSAPGGLDRVIRGLRRVVLHLSPVLGEDSAGGGRRPFQARSLVRLSGLRGFTPRFPRISASNLSRIPPGAPPSFEGPSSVAACSWRCQRSGSFR